ncbi:MAG: nucleotidyltransferase domain-containing protein [Cyanobacteria bacterium J06635_15]
MLAQRPIARYHQGRSVAEQAAQHLKTRWGASKVVLFGSLLTPDNVHSRSDIDLAVWGLPEADYLSALADLLDLDPDFSIDLVEADYASPNLLRAIQAGIDL